ncbi:MAG: hypothetical protein D3922_05885 [Candidatus Electrothrix sp. AR1]|nr:hypothetical protein [Candidatus Electrothrix sp. AR1]
MDTEQNQLTPDSSAVMKHIDMYQGIINRMAGNSASCKQWAIGLASAILVLMAKEGKIEFAWLIVIPVLLFCFLDAYYLALEKQFRSAYGIFIKALHEGELQENQLYIVKTDGKLPKAFVESLSSWAVWPFYGGMLGLVAVAVNMI